MRNTTRRLLSSACAFALAANGLAGAMAQDKKQDKSSQSTEQRTFVYQHDGKTFTIQGGDGQEPGIRFDEPVAGTIFRTSEGFNGSWVGVGGQAGGDGFFQFFSQEMSFDNRLVKDAPFSAETITESVQTLADGNRIVQRSEGRVYRDSQGRTRNERTYRMGGSNTERQTINIYDPVSGVNLSLDPATRTAHKAQFLLRTAGAAPSFGTASVGVTSSASIASSGEVPRQITVSGGVLQGSAIKRVQPAYPPIAKAAKASGAVQVQIKVNEAGEVAETSVVNGHPLLREAAEQAARQWLFKPTELSGKRVKVQGILTFNFTLSDDASPAPAMIGAGPIGTGINGVRFNANTEQLGKQMIEGVECEGTRSVTTLPAGAIGNENPIQTIRESWYSPELKMTLITKQNDPRFGESTYRVTNIVRAEPDATLFQVPNDYTVKEGNSFSFSTSVDGRGGTIFNGPVEPRKPKPDQQ